MLFKLFIILLGMIGLETLQSVTNSFLGRFVDFIYQYNGDGKLLVLHIYTIILIITMYIFTYAIVMSFAGDALICLFPIDTHPDPTTTTLPTVPPTEEELTYAMREACSRAIKCALETVDLGNERLSTHIAITCGRVHLAILGGVNDEWVYLMNGTCFDELHGCIDDAQAQEIVCTADVHRHVTDLTHLNQHLKFIKADSKTDNFYIETIADLNYLAEEDPHRMATLATQRVNRYMPDNAKARQFLPHSIRSLLLNGFLKSSRSELREVTTIFMSLYPLSTTSNTPSFEDGEGLGRLHPASFQPFFRYLQETLLLYGGYLRQFLFDDKGCVVIIMWGLPSHTFSNDTERAIYTAHVLLNNISTFDLTCSIGLSSGTCYTGIVGSSVRADYVAIGHTVNMAARLMSKAEKGQALICPTMYSAIKACQKDYLIPHTQALQMKGFAAPVTPYTFTASDTAMPYEDEDDTHSSLHLMRANVANALLTIIKGRVRAPADSDPATVSDAHASSPHQPSTVKSTFTQATTCRDTSKSFSNLNTSKSDMPSDRTAEETTTSSKRPLITRRASALSRGMSSVMLTKQASRRMSLTTTGMSLKKEPAKSLLQQFRDSIFDTIKSVTPTSSTKRMKRSRSIDQTNSRNGSVESNYLLFREDSHSNKSRRSFTQGSSYFRELIGLKPPDDGEDKVIDNKHAFVIIRGAAGTGKRPVIRYFRRHALKHDLVVRTVVGRFQDQSSSYSIIRQIFWTTLRIDERRVDEGRRRILLLELFNLLDEVKRLPEAMKTNILTRLYAALIPTVDSSPAETVAIVPSVEPASFNRGVSGDNSPTTPITTRPSLADRGTRRLSMGDSDKQQCTLDPGARPQPLLRSSSMKVASLVRSSSRSLLIRSSAILFPTPEPDSEQVLHMFLL